MTKPKHKKDRADAWTIDVARQKCLHMPSGLVFENQRPLNADIALQKLKETMSEHNAQAMLTRLMREAKERLIFHTLQTQKIPPSPKAQGVP
jgi:hypothetical protein